jgi:hypothetical protein
MTYALGTQIQNVSFAQTSFTSQMDLILFGIQQSTMAHCATMNVSKAA